MKEEREVQGENKYIVVSLNQDSSFLKSHLTLLDSYQSLSQNTVRLRVRSLTYTVQNIIIQSIILLTTPTVLAVNVSS
jgi:hypothetical protein